MRNEQLKASKFDHNKYLDKCKIAKQKATRSAIKDKELN